jgi:peptidoglycan/xylan/chitin deacetylase (PgdA/CDA1 family)
MSLRKIFSRLGISTDDTRLRDGLLTISALTLVAVFSATSACGGSEQSADDDDDDDASESDDDDDDDDDSSASDDDDDNSSASDDDDDDSSASGDDDDDTDSSASDDDDDDTGGDDDDDTSGDDDDDDTSGDDDDDDETSGDDDDDDAGCGEGEELSALDISSDVPKWKNDAKGAYTIFHDDTCWDFEESHFKVAAPELEKRGLIAAFGMVAAGCDGWDPDPNDPSKWVKADWDSWDGVAKLAAAGHELVNHSFAHITVEDGSYDMAQEIDKADELMRKKVTVPMDFYIFPQDLSSETQISRLQELDYLGARTGQKGGMNQADSLDVWHLNYDVHASPTGVGSNPHQLVELDDYVDQAIDSGGYAIREFHAVVDSLPSNPDEAAWMIVKSEYTAHLDHVEEKAKSGDLWVTGPAHVIRYQASRQACPEPVFEDGVIKFDNPSDECKRNSEELSYPVELPDGISKLQGEQDGLCFESVEANGKVFLNLNPSLGDAKVWGVK